MLTKKSRMNFPSAFDRILVAGRRRKQPAGRDADSWTNSLSQLIDLSDSEVIGLT